MAARSGGAGTLCCFTEHAIHSLEVVWVDKIVHTVGSEVDLRALGWVRGRIGSREVLDREVAQDGNRLANLHIAIRHGRHL